MAYIFADDVNFNYNLTSKLRHDNLITFPSLTAAEKGFVFFHTANNKFYGWTGTTWLDFSLSGGGGGGDVFLAANQTFTGANTFASTSYYQGSLILEERPSDTRAVILGWQASTVDWFGINHGAEAILWSKDNKLKFKKGSTVNNGIAFDFTNTAERTYTFPNVSGTVALDGDYVDLTTTQSVGGLKSFTSAIHAQSGQIIFNDDAAPGGYASGGAMGYLGASQYYFFQDHATVADAAGILDFDSLTADRTYTFPDKGGAVGIEETGTFTPDYIDTNGVATYTYGGTHSYARTGNLVVVQMEFENVIKTGTATGTFLIDEDSLPFAPSNINGETIFNSCISQLNNLGTTFYMISLAYGNFGGGGSGFYFKYKNSLTDDLNTSISQINSGTTGRLHITYYTADL